MNKDDIISQMMSQLGRVEQGELNALDAYVDFYEVEKSVIELSKQLKALAIEEMSKYDSKEKVVKGDYELSVRSMTRHSYKNDEHWQSIKQVLSNRESLMKKAYAMSLKGQTLTDPETGEVIPPSEASTSTSIVAKYIGGFKL